LQAPLNYVLAFALAIALLIAGVFFVRRPEKMYRVCSFGQSPNQFGGKLFRMVGWFYICGGAIGVLMLVVSVFLNFFRSR